MTMWMTEVLRLDGNEPWEQWGESWMDQADRIAEIGIPGFRHQATLERAGFESRRLDWGATMFVLSREELERYFGPYRLTPVYPARVQGEDWTRSVSDLDEGQYGVVIIECY